jgi:hypothetical protein
MGGRIGQLEVGPGAGREEIFNRWVGTFGECGNNAALAAIYAETGGCGEGGEEGERRRNMVEGFGGKGQVISESKGAQPREVGESGEERIIAEDKKEGREGATLFDASVYIDTHIGWNAEEGGYGDVVEGAFDKEAGPVGETHVTEDFGDPFVVDRIEGLGSV